MDTRDFTRLLDRFSLSAEGYRKVRKGVQKRIVRHMQELRCPAMKDYLARIDADRDAEAEARRLMDVSISRFFRDEPLWRALEAKVIVQRRGRTICGHQGHTAYQQIGRGRVDR